jgi:hypothetical protein
MQSGILGSLTVNSRDNQILRQYNILPEQMQGGRLTTSNSAARYWTPAGDGDWHDNENLPLLLAGRGKGTLRRGRRVRAAVKTPMCNLHMALLHRTGVNGKMVRRQHGPAARHVVAAAAYWTGRDLRDCVASLGDGCFAGRRAAASLARDQSRV